jgi:hypothetical protein
MAITVKHKFVSAIPDSGDTDIVQPSNWNDDHELTGTIPVANGGTGASTLTGYVKGTGTTAMTASATIPNTDITGLGTASTKDAGSALGVATLDASGKVPVSELPAAVLGALSYQGTWNASTNTPTLTSSTGTKGYYYVVSVAGNTNLDGITDWLVGDWAVYNGTVWQKVDNTETVTSVNGQTGAVVLTTTNIAEGTNEYFTTARARASVSAGTGITYDSSTGVITNSLPSLGGDVVGPSSATDNAVARFDTTTGKLIQNSTTTIDDSGVLSTSKGLIGSGANLTDYPNAQVVSTQSKISGYGHNYRIGLVGEAQGNSSDTTQWGVGVYGKGWTSGDTRCAGLEGDAGVTNSADTGTATAIRAYSKSTHSGGLNVGLTIDVTGSSVGNYALYMQNGNLFSAAAQSWELVDGSNSALRFNATGKTGILDIITTNGAEGIATSGALGVTGTATLGALGVTGTSSLTNLSVTGTTSFDGSEGSVGQVLTSAGSGATPTWTTPTTGTVTSVSGTAPIASSGGNTPTISISQATTSTDGYLSSTDWNTFNGKQPAGTYVNSVSATSPITSTGGTTPTIAMPAATGSVNGYLTSTDWTTFNSKGSGTVTSVGGTGTVNGLTLTGTVTSSGNLTLGGTLDLSSPPAIGGTAPNTVNGTVLNATNGIVINSNTVSASYTIPSGSSGMSAGPMTVASGQTVTVSSGSRWVIL